MKIGFIGLGIMGRPMALNLHNAQHSLIVPDRASLADDIRAVAEVVPDAKTVAEKSEVVILMVPDTPDVENVLFAPNGVAAGLSSRQTGDRHVLDQPDRDQGICQEDQRSRLRLSGRAGVRRRGGCQAGHADHHGRRPGSGIRPRQAAVRSDGQEHHPCRIRERRRPDLQGGEPDHRRAEHPGSARRLLFSRQRQAPIQPRCGRR